MAGHELRCLMELYNVLVPNVRLPLFCLIDFRGYRLSAISLLPINESTIVYGSCNAGLTIHDSSTEMNEAMDEVGVHFCVALAVGLQFTPCARWAGG